MDTRQPGGVLGAAPQLLVAGQVQQVPECVPPARAMGGRLRDACARPTAEVSAYTVRPDCTAQHRQRTPHSGTPDLDLSSHLYAHSGMVPGMVPGMRKLGI